MFTWEKHLIQAHGSGVCAGIAYLENILHHAGLDYEKHEGPLVSRIEDSLCNIESK